MSTQSSLRRLLGQGSPNCSSARFQRTAALGFATLFSATTLATSALAQSSTITFKLSDFAQAPLTGTTIAGALGNSSYVARINFMTEEPGSDRVWINDLNGPLYFFDRTTKEFTQYLDFNKADTHTGLYGKLAYTLGYGGGFITFEFHPEYATLGAPHYGVFYTVHCEDPFQAGSYIPDNTTTPGLDVSNYTITPVVIAPGPDQLVRHSVVVEWRDTNPTDDVFTGTAREILRVENNMRLHPIGDLSFNPRALPGDADYGMLYLASGDGGDGETNQAVRHANPQSLATLVGKILRINPDDPDGDGPLTYGIPADNPFVSTPGARGEIYAYGFRNCHRFTWDYPTGKLIVEDIGFRRWEEVNLVDKGGNYGWGEREGIHLFDVTKGTQTFPLPANDASFGYIYPVIEYPHFVDPAYPTIGDAVSNGFVYRGTKFPYLHGKYLFGDITIGELYIADYAAMLAAHDGNPATLAQFQKIKILWDTPLDADTTPELYNRMYEIVEDGYEQNGGPANNLPGSAGNAGQGRADIRLAVDSAGEIYIMSKSDGVIRILDEVTATPVITNQPDDITTKPGRRISFTVEANGSPAPSYQWQVAAAGSETFVDVVNDSFYQGATTATLAIHPAKLDMSGNVYRCIVTNSVGSVASTQAILTVRPNP